MKQMTLFEIGEPLERVASPSEPNIAVDKIPPPPKDWIPTDDPEAIPLFLVDGKWVALRYLTQRESFRLMGFTDDDFDKCTAAGLKKSALYKVAGNSIVVDCVEALFKSVFESHNLKFVSLVELFGGIGAPRKAAERLLGKDNVRIVDYVEFDPSAVTGYNAIHGDNRKPNTVVGYSLTEPCDVLFHGSPCQDFSVAGKGAGGHEGTGTRSSLLWETVRIIKETPSKPRFVFWENVGAVLHKKHKPTFDAYLSAMGEIGYQTQTFVMNAADYGIPQRRVRVFAVSHLSTDLIPIPDPVKRECPPLAGFLENPKDVPNNFFVKNRHIKKAIEAGRIKIAEFKNE